MMHRRLLFLLPCLVPLFLNAAPSEIVAVQDLSAGMQKAGVTARLQGARGTCSVFTVVAAMEFALAKVEPARGRLSVEYLNWASNETVGHAMDGGFFSDLWKGYESRGICLEEEMPYAPQFDPAAKPAQQVVDAAMKHAGKLKMEWIKKWNVRTGLTAEQLSAIRATLAKGWPVCGGFRWPRVEEWNDGLLAMRPPEGVFDGHSILITGSMADSAQPGGGTFTFYNTNRPGTPCRMTWEYAMAYMNDAMWIEPARR